MAAPYTAASTAAAVGSTTQVGTGRSERDSIHHGPPVERSSGPPTPGAARTCAHSVHAIIRHRPKKNSPR